MPHMRLSRRNTNLVMFTCTENSLAVLTHHRAADHSHCSAYLADFALDPYFRPFNHPVRFVGMGEGKL
jgi:hypothetical protein